MPRPPVGGSSTNRLHKSAAGLEGESGCWVAKQVEQVRGAGSTASSVHPLQHSGAAVFHRHARL
jgi:hypothetical protein